MPVLDLSIVRSWIDASSRVVALTGAGISTESGIPDFRGPKGVWTKNPAAEKQSTIQNYLAEPEVRKAAWRSRLDSPAWSAEPNAGHRALVALLRTPPHSAQGGSSSPARSRSSTGPIGPRQPQSMHTTS